MKKRLIIRIVALELAILSSALAQNDIPNAFFFNANIGNYLAMFPSANSGFTYGGGMGIQFFNGFIVSGKITFLSVKSTPLVHYYDSSENGHLVRDGTSVYKQWFYAIALQYKLTNEKYVMASICGGILFSKIKETSVSEKYSYSSENQSNNIVGGFLGGELEFRLPGQPFSIVGDAQLGYSSGDRTYSGGDIRTETFSGFNLSVGFRYYIQI